jgi:diguanylate cyclase (GGDEF)-like protein/PAS domain S-box-containing protein
MSEIHKKDNSGEFPSLNQYICNDNQKIKIPSEICEQKYVQETYRMLEHAVEQSIDGIAVADMKGVIRFCNQAWAQMHGYSIDELLGKHLSIFHTKEQMQKEVIPFNEQVKQMGFHQGEVGHLRKDGTIFPAWMTTTILKDEKSRPVGLIGIARDITERKRFEIRLSRMNQGFLDFGPDPNENIDRLVGLCGELMGADCALYNRLEGDILYCAGKWNIPRDYKSRDRADGHICYDVINRCNNEFLVIRNLPETCYARTDPNVLRYNLHTYIGLAVRFGGTCIGSLCVLYKKDFVPSEDDKKFMQIIASAIAVEEKRKSSEEALRGSEERYRYLFEESPAITLIVDKCGVIKDINNYLLEKFGYSKNEIIGRSIVEFVVPEHRSIAINELRKAFKNKHTNEVEIDIYAKDNSIRTLLFSPRHVFFSEGGRATHMLFTGIDVTERKRTEARQTAVTTGLRAVVSATDELLACSDEEMLFRRAVELARDKFGLERCAIFIEENGYIRGIYGTNRKGYTTDERTQRFAKTRLWKKRLKMLRPGDPTWVVVNEPYLEWNGKRAVRIGQGWVAITPIQSAQRPIGVFVNDAAISKVPLDAVKQDTLAVFCSLLGNIVERKRSDAELEALNKELIKSNKILKQLSVRDSHTGLYNHRYLQEAIESEFYRARRYANPLSVIMLDLDYFKSINDVYGHQFGDLVLKQFARLLKRTVRKYDIIIRFGGEEFIIISPQMDKAHALELAQRLLNAINLYNFGNDKHSVKLKISVAVASYPKDNIVKCMDLIELADKILHKAKIDGGDRVYSWSDITKKRENLLEKSKQPAEVRFLKEKIDRLHKRASQSLIESVFAFAKTIKLKDRYTGDHVESTVNYATEIAKRLNLSRQEIEFVRRASMVHDLGKIGISERILLKKSKLSDKEFSIIKKHPQIGADILRPIHSFHDIIPLILYHHERWDGTGYPRGLKREEIPLGARIVAIADVYQALISDRPYRKAYSKYEAKRIIQDGAGSQFDPQIVDIFLKII